MPDHLAPAPPAAAPVTRDVDTLTGPGADGLGLVVAPTTGRFEPASVSGRVRAGDLLGYITGGRGRADEVRVPVDALLEALLVREGDNADVEDVLVPQILQEAAGQLGATG